MKVLRIISFCFVILMGWNNDVQATHIVGGEMRYRCLGGNFYRIYLTMRRDCFNGAPDAQFDDPAFVTVFTPSGEIIEDLGQNGVFSLPYQRDDTLNEIQTSTCQVIGPDVCVHTTTYFFDVELPFRRGGYLFVYQRCCFNSTLINITDPLSTGLTTSIQITEDALRACNSSPDYRSWPNIYLCQNDTFTFDHSARDVDGDSVVYELCAPFRGANRTTPKPTQASPPPYTPVDWRAPYDLSNLMGGWPLRIEANTGLLTGAPNTIGQFLVGVCLREYRDGKLLSVSRRAFEYNVRECPERPIADFFTNNVLCDGFTAEFSNNSSGQDYEWFFDYENDRSKTSTETNPTYTYSEPGIYTVALFALRDSTCFDSTFQEVVIYGDSDYSAEFDYSIDECEEEIVLTLEDRSYDNLFGIQAVEWTIESSDTTYVSNNRNERYVFDKSDTLTITLIATTDFGCQDTTVLTLPINILAVDFIGDQIAICEGDTTFLLDNPDPAFDYVWLPPTGLSCSDCPNPMANPVSDIFYTVIVSDGNCSISDTVFVTVNENLLVDILGDTIACQEEVDLRASSGVEQNAIWSYDRDMTDVFATGTNEVTVSVDSILKVYLMSSTAEDCLGNDSIEIERQEVFFDADTSLKVCQFDTFEVNVDNLIPHHQLNFDWQPANQIVSGANTASPSFTFQAPGNYSISFTATNQFDCSKNGEILVQVVDLPEVGFDVIKACDSLTVDFINLSGSGEYRWEFGDGDTSEISDPTHTYATAGDYLVTLSVEDFCYNEITQNINVGLIEVDLPDTIISCAGEPVKLNPDPDTNLLYTWTPSVFLDDPNSPNPTATVVSSTNFTVTIQDTTFEDCFIEREVYVLVTEPIKFNTNTSDTILCYSDTVRLSADGAGDYFYCWIDEAGDTIATDQSEIIVVVEDEEVYTVIAKDIYDCSESKTIRVKRFDFNVAIAQPDTICFMDATRLSIENLGEGPLTYMWTPVSSILEGANSDNPLVSPDFSTTYTVKITNEFGCEYFDTVRLIVDRVMPRPQITSTKDTIYLTDTTQLQVIGGPYASYEWFPTNGLSCTDCPDPIASPENETTYGVWVTNLRGCIDSAFITIGVIRPNCDDSDVYVPNAFSPNGDDNNDVWRVRSNFVDLIDVYVYNRWGEKVFETHEYDVGWDGTYEGEFLEPDVYAYYIRVVCVDQSEFTKKGNVTLVR
ncbi:MAG: PKD domain-containing protein [Saprospiraceae bacterium]|nr:PKD domain-containing protein [Saprospiraceae bacterium]